MVPMAQWVGQQGFEAGSNPNLYLHFLNLNFTTEKCDNAPPLLCMKGFETRILLKPGRVPIRNFSVL